MARKGFRFTKRSKHKKENPSRKYSIDDDAHQERTEVLNHSDWQDPTTKNVNEKSKSSKRVHIAFLPEKYEPLREEDSAPETRDDKNRKKHKHKNFRKNVGKAIRFSWKCLVVGLQNLSSGYSMPMGSTATTVVPEFYRAS